jgi:hypothetical protein
MRVGFQPLMLVAGLSAYSIELLHSNASQSHQVQVALARVNGLAGLIDSQAAPLSYWTPYSTLVVTHD